MQLPDLEQAIPGLAEARARERFARTIALLDTEVPLCGLWCRQLTLRMVYELEFSANRFFVGGRLTETDVLGVLWRLSPNFKRGGGLRVWWLRRQVLRHIRRRKLSGSIREIGSFIADSEQDRPASKVETKPDQPRKEAGCHWVAAYINFFSNQYGWNMDQVLDSPIARLNQLYRAWHHFHGSNVPVISRSDRLISAWARALREAMAKNKEGSK